ncbi:MAG: DUF1569 domain-containing protein [Planctomycetes bacterium]|nr:DUF1569 domain-containing protein [Planctomycetota bacterium]
MSIDTAKVPGRRSLRFQSLDDILADVDKLNQGPLRALGNWSSGQILVHLATVMDWCIDGAPMQAPWFVRVMGWFMKNRFLRNPMPAGFALPEAAAKYLVPKEKTWDDGLRHFRSSIERMKSSAERKPSPFLGELTRDQWDQLHCRHAELHLSFLIPGQNEG